MELHPPSGNIYRETIRSMNESSPGVVSPPRNPDLFRGKVTFSGLQTVRPDAPEGFVASWKRPLMPIIETRDLRKIFRSVIRGEGLGGARRTPLLPASTRTRSRSRTSRCRSNRASWSATSGPTAPASRPRSRCSPASSSRPRASCGWPGSSPTRGAAENARNIGVVFGQRSQLYWDLPLRESFELLRAIYGVPPERYRANMAHFIELLEMERVHGDAGAPALARTSGCAATSPRRCCTTRRSFSSTSRRSASTSWPRKRSGRSSPTSTASAARRSSSRPTTLADVERLCRRIMLIDEGHR